MITRRMIKNYFKTKTSTGQSIPKASFLKLAACWETHGHNSEKCAHIVDMIHRATGQGVYKTVEKENKEDKDLKVLIMDNLERPMFKYPNYKQRERTMEVRKRGFHDVLF